MNREENIIRIKNNYKYSVPRIARMMTFVKKRNVQEMFTRGEEPTPTLHRHFRGHRGSLTALDFHPIQDALISGDSVGQILLWDIQKVEKRALWFEGHTGAVNDVGFNSTGELMVSGSDDHSVRIWVPLIRGECRIIRGHSAPVRSVSFNPVQPDYILSASDDKTVKLWNIDWSKNQRKVSLSSHGFVSSWCDHTNWVRSVRFGPDGVKAITASDDGTVNILDTRKKEIVLKCTIGKGSPSPVNAEFNPTTDKYFGVATSAEFMIYDTRNSGKMVQCYQNIHSDEITKFNFHSSGDFAITVSKDKTLKILDVIEGRPIFTLFGPKGALFTVSSSRDGMYMATGGKDKDVYIYKPIVIPYTIKELKKVGALAEESLPEDEEDLNVNEEQSGETEENSGETEQNFGEIDDENLLGNEDENSIENEENSDSEEIISSSSAVAARWAKRNRNFEEENKENRGSFQDE